MAAKPTPDGRKIICVNKQARRLFHIEDRFEAGLVLQGSEVKSLRGGRINLKEGYVRIDDGEAWMVGVHIPTYEQANINNHEPTRDRKVLLSRRQLQKFEKAVRERGTTLVPLQLHFRGAWAKLELE